MGLVRKIHRKTRDDGVLATIAWAGSALTTMVLTRGRHVWYDLQDTYSVTRAGCEATFPSPVDSGGVATRRPFQLEDQFLTTVISELESDDVFWDVGANLGVYTCLAADRITDGEIVAVEPNPQNAEQLRTNLALNDAESVTVLETAVGDIDDTVTFEIPESRSFATAGTVADIPEDSTESVEVPQRQVATLVENRDVPPPTVMKLDIEGGEALAVQGMGDALESCRVLFSEVHHSDAASQSIQTFGMTVEEYRDRLTALGFDNEIISERNTELHVKSVDPALVDDRS